MGKNYQTIKNYDLRILYKRLCEVKMAYPGQQDLLKKIGGKIRYAKSKAGQNGKIDSHCTNSWLGSEAFNNIKNLPTSKL